MSLINKNNRNTKRSRNASDEPRGKSVSAYSYHNARNDLEDNIGRDSKRPRVDLKSGNFWLNRFGFIIFVIVCLVCVYSVLELSPDPKIVYLGNDSSYIFKQYQPAFVINSNKLFKESILNRNKITVDTNKITKDLESEFPEFSSISITLPLINHRPIIYVVPSDPSVVLNNSQGQYLLNQNGVAMLYGESTTSFNYLSLPVVDDQSGLHINLGQAALTSQDISFIQAVLAQLTAKQFKVSSLTLPQSSDELDVRLVGESYYIKFNLESNNPKLEAGDFMATQHYLASQNITPTQYIDVMSDGRAYYQ